MRRAPRLRARASSPTWDSPTTFSSSGTSFVTPATRAYESDRGAGSSAGCCVAYCLRIVDIDPLRYGLIFERFLNPGRRQMPDIDMDFDERYRGDMIRYAAERYGVRPRGSDRDLLDDQGPRRGARRRARARLPAPTR